MSHSETQLLARISELESQLDEHTKYVAHALQQQSSSEHSTNAVLFDEAPYSILELDCNNIITSINRVAISMLGFSDADSVIGCNYLEFIAQQDRAAVQQHLYEAYSGNKVEFICNTVSQQILKTSVSVLAQGSSSNLMVFCDDRTESVNSEKAYRTSEQKHRLLIEHSPYCIHEINRQGQLTSMNKAGLNMMGTDDFCHIAGMPYLDAVCDHDRPAIQKLLDKAHEGESSEFTFQASNGLFFQSCFVPVLGSDDAHIMGITQDITERTKTEKELSHALKMDALGKLIGGISHDFNNLLGVILGYTELLQCHTTNPTAREKYVEQIHHAGTRAKELTGKLLGFSRKKPNKSSPIDLKTQLGSFKDILQKSLTARIKLTIEIPDDIWPVEVDIGDFENSIINICINSMHALDAQSNGEISITAQNITADDNTDMALNMSTNEVVVVTIRDNGCGMDQDTTSKIFDPFYSTKGDNGTGLGLSQVYGFMQRCGGNVLVDSALDSGTNLYLYFPRHNGQTQAVVSEKQQDVQPFAKTKKILVVDDEAPLRDLASEILTSVGYTVKTARNGKEALQRLSSESFDLLFCDIIMPEMGGHELTQKAKQLYPDLKIQLVSGFVEDERFKSTDQKLVSQSLQKPYDRIELINIINQFFQHDDTNIEAH